MQPSFRVGQLLEVVKPADMRWFGVVFRVTAASALSRNVCGVVVKLGQNSSSVTRVNAQVELAEHKLRLVRSGFGAWVKEIERKSSCEN